MCPFGGATTVTAFAEFQLKESASPRTSGFSMALDPRNVSELSPP
jgi:hypothetical protein